MAILLGGPNSGFSGKAGSVVGYQRFGKWIIRGLPRESPKNKKGSPEQNVRRRRFTQVQHFLAAVLPFIRVGFNLEARKKGNTAHNSATSWNMLNAFNEKGELDYSKARVSAGSLAGARNAAVSTAADREIVFTWEDNSLDAEYGAPADASDQVMLLAYHPQVQDSIYLLSGARRSSGRESLKLPRKMLSGNDKWHTWIAFISDERTSISTSEYLGLVEIMEI